MTKIHRYKPNRHVFKLLVLQTTKSGIDDHKQFSCIILFSKQIILLSNSNLLPK